MKKIGFFATAILIAFTISCNNASTEKSTGSAATDTAIVVKDNTAPAASVPEGMALMTNSDCMTCHNATTKVVGPSFADIAAKYPNNPDNITRLVNVVISGGSGVWGSVPMPPHAGLSKADAEKMVGYILSVHNK